MNKIIAVVGPTASGKTALGIRLAKNLSGEIISADSMQLYRKMNIGTAKPTEAEKEGVPHKLIDILDIHENFSVSDYCSLCETAVQKTIADRKLPIICGGTGFYVDSFLDEIKFGEFENLPQFREEMNKVLQEKGVDYLYEKLCSVDPKNTVDRYNPKRVIRALEVYEATGKTLAQLNEESRPKTKKYESLIIGLTFETREELYDRINLRVDKMMDAGLLSEVESLVNMGIKNTATASQAIGYKEFYPYFDNLAAIDECVEKLKTESRRYAKRQMTWFRRNKNIRWINVSGKEADDIEKEALSLCYDFLNKE